MLTDKVILITGAGSGIGRSSAKVFADAGAKVALLDRNECPLRELAQELCDAGRVAHPIVADITDEEQVHRAVDSAVAVFGRLDGAFNNAGLATRHKPLQELSAEDWDTVMAVNLRGVFLCLKWQIRAMQGKGGAIVNNSSVLGMMGMMFHGEYVSAKHGVIGLTRTASIEYPLTKVRVNAVLPGLVMTPMVEAASREQKELAAMLDTLKQRHSIGRFVATEDIGRAAKWLLSDEASSINGVCLPVDGGYSAR